jgi:hypothetical protein
MPLTEVGRDLIAATLVGGGTPIDAAHAYLGVGDSTAAFALDQTDLQAATNKARQPVDAGFPIQIANVIELAATFPTTEANWAWNEWAVFNHPSGGTMLSRLVDPVGTKEPSQSWAISVTLSVTDV